MHLFGLSFLFLGLLTVGHGSILQTTVDANRLQSVLREGVKSKDIPTLYYSVKGLKQLNTKIPDICQTIKGLKYDLENVEEIFYLTNTASLSGCINSLSPDVMSIATQTLDNKDASLQDLYYAVYILKALGKGQTMDKDEALKNLVRLLKKDDSPINYGYMFALCEHMGCEAWTVAHAEALLLAADESDGRALHFEGGLPTTALILSSLFRTFKTQKKPSPLTAEQRHKFAEYLLSRRTVSAPRGAALLLDAAAALADDEPTPMAVVVKGKKYITSQTDSIEVSVTDLLGRPLRALRADEVVAQSGTRLADDVVVLSKQQLTQKPDDPSTFVLNLSKIKTQYGMYKIALSAAAESTSVTVAVLGELGVASVEVGVGDVDGTTGPKVTTVTYPNKLTERLQADHLQKVSLKFTVRDKQNKAILVQQAFVRVGDASGRDEIIYVAEPDNAKAYRVELNVGAFAKHVQQRSGVYSLSIYVGDASAAAPVAWPLGDVRLSLGAGSDAAGEPAEASPRGARPEIRHEFREASARPPRLLSDAFAAACAAPLLLLLLLWARLRVNLAHFPFALSAVLFHCALGGSLGLYAMLWLRLSMFDTARYLLPLGALTFLSGHRLLRRLVADKQQK